MLFLDCDLGLIVFELKFTGRDPNDRAILALFEAIGSLLFDCRFCRDIGLRDLFSKNAANPRKIKLNLIPSRYILKLNLRRSGRGASDIYAVYLGLFARLWSGTTKTPTMRYKPRGAWGLCVLKKR
ncbi:MAG: hypothetical protein ACFNTA_01145 [Campylobacter sp.]|uniref:hypothetical protein n=1 Tax=Campylobacter sp. TaxID=205 RepID=UPI00360F87DA